jgi:AcrR family transcriptional regulator
MAGKGRQRPRAAHQLPPGRHKLGRSFVAANQRERILDAVADVASLSGYAAMSVEDVIGTAGVSRRTFYDTFTSKEDAFLAALDEVVEDLLAQVRAAYGANETFAGGVRDCLAVFLQFSTDEPRYADLLLIESLAAGPAAIERRNTMLKTFAAMLHDSAERLTTGRRPPELTAETIVGGIYEVVYSRLIAGEAPELPGLLPDLAYSMMQPYIGHDEARREAAKPSRVDIGAAPVD